MAIRFYLSGYYVFSNFSPHAIEFRGKLYPTAEHAYQAAKCSDPQGKEAIRTAFSPLRAKQLANGPYKEAKIPRWNEQKLTVMEEILRAKADQHKEVRDALSQSRSEELVEDSPLDYFWGRGRNGTGDNQLGQLWMKLRDELLVD